MLFHNGETISGYLLVGMKSLCQASGRTLCAVYRRPAGFSVLIPGKFFPTTETFCSLKSLGSHDRHVQYRQPSPGGWNPILPVVFLLSKTLTTWCWCHI